MVWLPCNLTGRRDMRDEIPRSATRDISQITCRTQLRACLRVTSGNLSPTPLVLHAMNSASHSARLPSACTGMLCARAEYRSSASDRFLAIRLVTSMRGLLAMLNESGRLVRLNIHPLLAGCAGLERLDTAAGARSYLMV